MPETNKDAAVSFLKLGSSGKVNEAYAKYTDIRFVHHNPYFEGSAQSLASGMANNALQNPDKIFEVKHIIAEGDMVVVHSHVRLRLGDLGVALVHIFRFDSGRIVELWDIGQPVPEKSPNQYGMF